MNEYIGTDNLEVMVDAVNYNSYLLGLIRGQLKPGMRILDIGAGIGTFAKLLQEDGYDVMCFEPDKDQVSKIQSIGLNVTNCLGSLEPDHFDFVYSLNVLEHIQDDHNAMKEWHRLIKPGGKMLIYVPAFQVLYSTMDEKVGHFRRYKKSDLLKLANEVNLKVSEARYADSVGFLAAIIYKYSNKNSGNINRRMLIIYDRCFFPMSKLLDSVFGAFIGKNVYMLIEKPNKL